MTEKNYTGTDVETVGTAIRDAGTKNASFGPSAGSWEVEEKQWQYDDAASAVLDALTAAGWRRIDAATVGRCGNQMPYPIQDFGYTRLIFCELPAGHAGWHRSGVTEWGEYVRRTEPTAGSEPGGGAEN